ncbi:MAG: serine/threonine-protein phosphatase [Flavobacteriaceae bacterium]|nr:serine/threonine-protein phosphatase [Flavobacteriaceae bacterium]
MSMKQTIPLIILLIMVGTVIIGMAGVYIVNIDTEKKIEATINIYNIGSTISDLYIQILKAEKAKNKSNSNDIYRDPNYINYYIAPIRKTINMIDGKNMPKKFSKNIDIIKQLSINYAGSISITQINEEVQKIVSASISNTTTEIESIVKNMNIQKDELIKNQIDAFNFSKKINQLLIIGIMGLIIITSIIAGKKLYNEILRQEKHYENIMKLQKEKLNLSAHINAQEQLAKDIQTGLLPTIEELKNEKFNISAMMKPAEFAGGDYYDVIIKNNIQWFVICDVTGHGLSSAIVMIMLKYATNMAINLSSDASPLDILYIINEFIHPIKNRLSFKGEDAKDIIKKQATFLIFKVYPDDHIDYAGNHPNALIYREKTKKVEKCNTHNQFLLVGKLPSDLYQKQIDASPIYHTTINKGDRIVLYTDGITESKKEVNGKTVFVDETGLSKLIEENANNNIDQVVNNIIESIKSEGFTTDDDITLLIAERK